MAIGKVGSFATVEPALVDFGAMAERNIDKIKAEEEAKKAAQAKGVADRSKELALPKPLDITTLNSADLKYGEMAQGLFNDMTYSKMLYEQTGSPEAKENFETLNYAYGQLTSNVASLKENIPKFNDPAFLKGKNLSIAQERAEYFQKLDEEGRMRVDGKNILVKKPDGGEFRLESFIPSMMNIPDDFDYQGFVKNVRDNTGPSTTSGGSYMLNWTKESILDPASSRQRDFIKNAVATQAYENESALVDYARKKGLKDEYGLTKTSGFTDEEKKEWIDQTYNDIINSFPSKEDKKYNDPNKGSGDDKEKFTYGIPVTLGSKVEDNAVSALTKKPGGLKGRAVFYGSNEGVEMGGKKATHIYATTGNNPSFAFQILDPTRAGYGGTSGNIPGYFWIKPDDEGYSAFVTSAKSYFKVDDEKILAKILRGEKIEKEEKGIDTSKY
jgi:hypothetical protein